MLQQYLLFMVTKKNYILACAIITALLFIEANCTKFPIDCANTKYSFELPVKGFPNKDTIYVGDTIELNINEATIFKDGFTGEMIDYSGAENLGTALVFQYFDSTQNNWIDAVDSFNFQLINGIELRKTKLVIEYRFIEVTGRFQFKLFVLPQKSGLFRLFFSNSNNTFRSSDKCTKASFAINFTETNHNRHLVGYTGPNVPGGDLNFYVK
jgi:hypothetical protein